MRLPDDIPLGKTTNYDLEYNPGLLCAIPRSLSRLEIGFNITSLPFDGYDIWTAYELSWLDSKGKPRVAIAEFTIAAMSENIIESKSFKLYLNSLNQTRFDSAHKLQQQLQQDVSACCGCEVGVVLYDADQFPVQADASSICLDELDVSCDMYLPEPALLAQGNRHVEERLCSQLFRSLCPVTGQPDWATIFIEYRGKELLHESLLKYLVAYRQHQGFHEQCIEQIFYHIWNLDSIDELTVYGRFLRRGGLDINPCRSSSGKVAFAGRDTRQ